MTATYCYPGATYKCSKCGVVRTRPEHLMDGWCVDGDRCAKWTPATVGGIVTSRKRRPRRGV